MFDNIKKLFKWSPKKSHSSTECKSKLLKTLFTVFEDILFWKYTWLSLTFIVFLNTIWLICLYKNLNLVQLLIAIAIVLTSIDAFESWLKYKHRSKFLQKLGPFDHVKLYHISVSCEIWIRKRWTDFIILRENNHAKAFLLTNILFGFIYLVGKSLSGFAVMYIISMGISLSYLVIPHIAKAMKKLQQHAESDSDIDSLIPVPSEQDIKDMNFELDGAPIAKRSIDYWKLEDVPPGESSDSSDNASVATNMSKDILKSLEKDVDVDITSDSSDDEYIPSVQQEKEFSTTYLDNNKINPDPWSNTAYNAFRNISGIVSSVVNPAPAYERVRVPSEDSSDGFEVIDKIDLT